MWNTEEKANKYSVDKNGVIRLNEPKSQSDPAPQPTQQPYPQQYPQPYPPYQQQYQQPYLQPYTYLRNEETNACGMSGFILSLLAVIFCGRPILAGILWLIGFIFSIIGLENRPKGFALAGLIISLSMMAIGLLLFIFAFSVMAALLSK